MLIYMEQNKRKKADQSTVSESSQLDWKRIKQEFSMSDSDPSDMESFTTSTPLSGKPGKTEEGTEIRSVVKLIEQSIESNWISSKQSLLKKSRKK